MQNLATIDYVDYSSILDFWPGDAYQALPLCGVEIESEPERIIDSETASLYKRVEQFLEILLYRGVAIDNYPKVLSELIRYPELTSLIIPMMDALSARTSPAPNYQLMYYSDPEIDHGYLLINVRQEPYDSNLSNHIDDTIREFSNELCQSEGWLSLQTDYQ